MGGVNDVRVGHARHEDAAWATTDWNTSPPCPFWPTVCSPQWEINRRITFAGGNSPFPIVGFL